MHAASLTARLSPSGSSSRLGSIIDSPHGSCPASTATLHATCNMSGRNITPCNSVVSPTAARRCEKLGNLTMILRVRASSVESIVSRTTSGFIVVMNVLSGQSWPPRWHVIHVVVRCTPTVRRSSTSLRSIRSLNLAYPSLAAMSLPKLSSPYAVEICSSCSSDSTNGWQGRRSIPLPSSASSNISGSSLRSFGFDHERSDPQRIFACSLTMTTPNT